MKTSAYFCIGYNKNMLLYISNIRGIDLNKVSCLVDENVINKISKFRHNDDKLRTIVGRLLLKRLTVDEIVYGDNGKPYLKNNDLYFNISHSDDLVILGISKQEIGVDIERIKDLKEKIVARFFSESEQLKIKNNIDFYKIWTAKESFIKYLGTGLKTSLIEIEVKENSIKYQNNSYYLNVGNIDDYVYSVCTKNTEEIEIIRIDIKKEIDKYTYGKIVSINNNGNLVSDLKKNDLKDIEFGDSVYLSFDNGVFLDDIPFLSDLYVRYGEYECSVRQDGETICFIQKSKHLNETLNVNKDNNFVLKLKEKQKYKKLEEMNKIAYSLNLVDYKSPECFANFWEVKVGDIKEKRLYRGASAFNNIFNRANTVSNLLKKYNIQTIVDLIDNEEMLASREMPELSKKYYLENKVICDDLPIDYRSPIYIKKLVDLLKKVIEMPTPWYFHCLEGKERTGYALIIVEALLGADLKEIITDYMCSFKNYYGIDKNDKERYAYILDSTVLDIIDYFFGDGSNLKEKAIILLSKNGLSEHEINKLIKALSK